MKLKSKFSIVAIVAAFSMIILTSFTFIGVSFIQKLKDFQYLQQSVQFGTADITNHLNTTVSWALDPKTIYTSWQNKTITLNKQFRELQDSPLNKMFPEDLQEDVQAVTKLWTKLIAKINPFNNQFKTMQQIDFCDEELNYIRRAGIRAAYEKFPDSADVDLLYSQQILIHSQMRDIISEEVTLQNQLTSMNQKLNIQIKKYVNIFYLIIIITSIIFCIIIYVFISLSTKSVTNNILRLRDFSDSLAMKDFRQTIAPRGTFEIQALMKNMNGMVAEINDFFTIVKKTAARAISSGYSINDSATSTAAATGEINTYIETITKEFEQISASVQNAVTAIDEINRQVNTLVKDNSEQTNAIDESTDSISNMAKTLVQIKENAELRTKSAEEMKALVSDGDEKISSTTIILEEVMSKLDEIGEVITIINSVSEQTNLLSMNAAIESAHAGDYGKGFAVVAEEIRSLAESTADNAQKINESITNIIKKVTQANSSSRLAAEAFSKVSNHSTLVIESLKEITQGIITLDEKTKQITQKTDVTATTADKINDYCTNLASQQKTISTEIDQISSLFNNAFAEIREIKDGASDIVKRMAAVGDLSKESYKNMTDLENVLEEFKTMQETEDAAQEQINENEIKNIISPELQAQLEADFQQADSTQNSTVEFNLDDVEEMKD